MGEVIEITYHGIPVAVLSPVSTNRIARLVAAGVLTPGGLPARPPKRFPVTGELTATQAIEEDR